MAADDCELKPEPVTVTWSAAEPCVTEAGERAVATGAGLRTVAVAGPVLVESTILMALMVAVFGEGGTPGAVYRPAVVTVPTVAFPPATSFTIHLTWELNEPVPATAAVNCCVAPVVTFAVGGVTLTDVIAGPPLPEPQPDIMPQTLTRNQSR
jgi:hypothetical protein